MSEDWWVTDDWKAKNVEVNRLLLEHFPELSTDYEREVTEDEWEAEGPMVVYSFVFFPLLRAALLESDNPVLRGRVVRFVDMLAEHPDRHYSATATVGIAEYLADSPELRARAQTLLGPTMKRALADATK